MEAVYRPYHVRLEAASTCQLSCPQCPTGRREALHIGRGFLAAEAFEAFLARHPYVRSVELSNYGEIFLNPSLAGIMAAAFRRGVGLYAANGVNLNDVSDAVAAGLVRCRFRLMLVSLDGATAGTYARYRRGGNFQKVIDTVIRINYYKKKYRSVFPVMGWQFVNFPHNAHEQAAARRMAKALGMFFTVRAPWGGSDDAPQAPRPPARRRTPTRWCAQLWGTPQINWDGKLLGCCVNHWGDFGNVFEDDLEMLMVSERMRYARRMLRGEAPAREDIPCARCGTFAALCAEGKFIRPAAMRRTLVRYGILARLARHAPAPAWEAARGFWGLTAGWRG